MPARFSPITIVSCLCFILHRHRELFATAFHSTPAPSIIPRHHSPGLHLREMAAGVDTSNGVGTATIAASPVANGGPSDSQPQVSARRERKRAKKDEARRRRLERIAKNGGPPETAFLGKHKWLGGAVDAATGNIYGIPSHSHQIICISPSTPESEAMVSTIPLPNEYQQGHFKWLRGLVHGGCLYGIPAWNTKGVLKMRLDTKEVRVLPLPREKSCYDSGSIPLNERSTDVDRGRWMWHGGAVGRASEEDGASAAIYCPPSNAEHVLKVYLDGSDRVEEIGPPLSDGQNKWYGE